MATLGLKEMGKFLWEGREKVLPSWLSQFSFANQVFHFGVGRHASFPQKPVVKRKVAKNHIKPGASCMCFV